MSSTENVKVMLNVFSAIERRDAQGFRELVHPDVELHWPARSHRVALHAVSSRRSQRGAPHGFPCNRAQLSKGWIRAS